MHVIHSLEMGGAENVVLSYAEHHDKSRYELKVCTLRSGGPLAREIEERGVKVSTINTRASDSRGLTRLISVFKREAPIIVHFHNPLPVFLGLPASIAAKVPFRVLTEHSISYPRRLGKWKWVYQLLCKRIDAAIACSEEVRKSHEGHFQNGRMVTIHNGIDVERFPVRPKLDWLRLQSGIPHGKLILGNIGNLSPQKGQRFLLKAVKLLLSQGIPVALVMIGDGPLRQALETQARDLGVGEDVHFLGQRNDVPELLREIDIVVGASVREGFSISILEAMASSKPVVCTDVGGNKEVIIDGVTGFLVPPNDYKALASAIIKFTGDTDLRIRMGASARKLIQQRFSVKSMVKRTELVYENLFISRARTKTQKRFSSQKPR